ncbi:MAG TPA: PspA/IM30 family protein [Chthoniobacteraceae bacterium]|jgi:phage shock protein A|nr:PspA/IM30 family protein [Chthoniobacteraceae bacterium]
MKLIPALVNLFRGADQKAADALADPIRDGAFAIQDAQKEVDQFLGQIHQLMTNTGMLESQLRDARADADKYDTIARRAAAAGNRDDVAAAVAAKQQAEKTLATLTTNVQSNRALEKKLRQQLTDARQKIATAEMNKARLSANLSGNKLRGNLAKASVEFSGKSKGLAALGRLEEADRKESAAADAWESLSLDTPDAKAASLEDKYGGATGSLDDEVERLMLSSGHTPPPLALPPSQSS